MTRRSIFPILATILAAAAGLTGQPAAAQGGRRHLRERLDAVAAERPPVPRRRSPQARLRERLDVVAAERVPDGDRVGNRRYGTIEAGREEHVRVRLRAGHCYAVVLVVEPGIRRMDVVVRMSGAELVQGAGLEDGTAVLGVCPTTSGSARLTITADGVRDSYAVGVYELPQGTLIDPGIQPGAGHEGPGGAAAGGTAVGGAWVVADAQVEFYAGRAFGFQSPIADQISSPAARPPAEVLGTEAILRRVAWYIKDNPAPVVFLGDAGQVGCRQEIDTVFRWLDVSGQPWVFVPGNHDCFPMGSIAPDALAAIGEAALTTLQDPRRWEEFTFLDDFISGALEPTSLFEQWAAACKDPSDRSAGPANKAWLVERVVEQFRRARSAAPREARDYWKEEHVVGDSSGDSEAGALDHWSSWVVQTFPLRAGDEPQEVAAIGVAVDTTDWSEPGEIVGLSPGSQGCISSAQVDAAVRLVADVRRAVGRDDLPVVMFGHHPADHQYGACALNLGRLASRVNPLGYVAGHTHRAAPAHQRELVVDLLAGTAQAVTQHVVGSVVEYGGPGEEPEIERLRLGTAAGIVRDRYTVQTIACVPTAGAPAIDCGDVWASPASPAETLSYQEATLALDARHWWLLLSLDHLRGAGRWCEDGPDGPRCRTLVGRCSSIYDEASSLLDGLAGVPLFGVPTGSLFATWQDIPDLLGCVRHGLGVDTTTPQTTDSHLERYVFCTTYRGSAIEAGADVGTPPSTTVRGAASIADRPLTTPR